MKVLATLELAPGRTVAELAPHVAPEARVLWDAYASGLLRATYYRTDRPGAVLEIESADPSEARALVERLPMVRAGLVRLADLIPTTAYTGFASLFVPAA
jgi:hypothetical protein